MALVRHFDFVGADSAKFWEITVDDRDVTVRWGRLGTTGQTKIKNFDSGEAAATHAQTLITEKTRKGYAETPSTTASTPAPPPPAPESPTPESPTPESPTPESPTPGSPTPESPAPGPEPVTDEDTFVLPTAWLRQRYPRRGSVGVTPVKPVPGARAAVTALIGSLTGYVDRVLAHPATEPELARTGRAWLAGDPAAEPLGAAAVAGASNHSYNNRSLEKMTAFADVWLTERGVVFAAEAAVELMSLAWGSSQPGLQRVADDRTDVPALRHRRPDETRRSWSADTQLLILARVRAALAACPEEQHVATVAALSRYRDGDLYQRAATSFLVPAQTAWVDEDCAAAVAFGDGYLLAVLLAAVGTAEQAEPLAGQAQAYLVVRSSAMLNTVVEGIGPDALGLLLRWLDRDWSDAETRRRLLSAVSVLPTDAAVQALIDRLDQKYVQPALLDMAGWFPVRAMRLYAANHGRKLVGDLLRAHVLAHPELAGQTAAQLPDPAGGRVRTILADAASVVEAPVEALPAFLVDPPWTRAGKPARPVVIAGLSCDDRPAIEWAAGERETWQALKMYPADPRGQTWEQIADKMRRGTEIWYEPMAFFVRAPEKLVRPLLATFRVKDTWDAGTWLRLTATRFGVDAHGLIVDAARRTPTQSGVALLPYRSPEIAVLMADWLARLKSVRPIVLSWLARHPGPGARALIPPALGPAGAGRRQAEQALRAIAGAGHVEAVRSAARQYGPEAAAAIGTFLDSDPLSVLPARIPPVPAWAAPAMLPPLQLRGGAGSVPQSYVPHVVTALAMSRLGEPYAGVAVLKDACEPASLAEFGWGLFQRWQGSGGAGKESWALDVLALVGDDETVRRLTPVIQTWPGEGGHLRAVTGVEVLAAIGTDVALMHLHGIAQRAKFKGLKAAANQKMDEVAQALGLSAEQLADRLVPDFGLDPDGSLTLNYGPRQFVVGFDEQLKPYVADPDGKRRKDLPKPGVNDDAELAPAAVKRFAALKKDVRTVATDQIRRLERAMVTRRRWTGTEFRELFVAHPLVWHIVRRLVWGVYDASGALVDALRVAEDRSLSDANDDPLTLPGDATVGVAHPLHLGAMLATWAEVFADYEILQPFPQLGREVHTLTPDEAAATQLARFEGRTVPVGRVIGLERRGWLRESPQDAGMQGAIEKVLPGGLQAVVEIDPGIAVSEPAMFPEQKLTAVYVHDGSGNRWRGQGRVPFGRLDPISVSELFRELGEVVA